MFMLMFIKMKKLEFPKCDNNKISNFQPPKFLSPPKFFSLQKNKNIKGNK